MNSEYSTDSFIEFATIWGDAISEGDSIKANRTYKKMDKLIYLLSKDMVKAQRELPVLVKNPNPGVRYWASMGLIELEINIGEACRTLQEMADDISTGLVGLMGEIAYKETMKELPTGDNSSH